MTNTLVQKVTGPSGLTTSTTASLTTTAVNDIIIFMIGIGNNFATQKVTGLSSSHTTGWQEIGTIGGVSDATLGERVQMWMGTASSVATANVTISYQAADPTNNFAAWQFEMFHSSISGALWGIDGSQVAISAANSASTASPSLTPSLAGGLYVGCIFGWNGTNGSTSGYTYTTPQDVFTDVYAYHLNAPVSATNFAATQTGGTAYIRGGVVLQPLVPAASRPCRPSRGPNYRR